MKYCSHCGAEIADDAIVCIHCGRSVESHQNASNTTSTNSDTKFCSHCGAEIAKDAVVCVHCGCNVESSKAQTSSSSDNSTMAMIVKVFMIICTVITGLCTLIGLAWCIPMTISVSRKLDNNEPISLAMKICTLIFVSRVAGILLLCMSDN